MRYLQKTEFQHIYNQKFQETFKLIHPDSRKAIINAYLKAKYELHKQNIAIESIVENLDRTL